MVFASGSAGDGGGEWATTLSGSWEAVDDLCSEVSRRWRNRCKQELVVMCVVPLLPLVLSFFTKTFPRYVLTTSKFAKLFLLRRFIFRFKLFEERVVQEG